MKAGEKIIGCVAYGSNMKYCPIRHDAASCLATVNKVKCNDGKVETAAGVCGGDCSAGLKVAGTTVVGGSNIHSCIAVAGDNIITTITCKAGFGP